MGALTRGVRFVLEVVGLVVGALLTVLAVGIALYSVAAPRCVMDTDATDARLVLAGVVGLWALTDLVLSTAVARSVLRSRFTGWARTAVAVGYPVVALIVWAVADGSLDGVLGLVGASAEGSSSCV